VNILLVEDDLDLAGALAGVLAPLGHHLVCCGDGMEALVAARRRPFDAMILDLGVPTIDGLQLLQRLRDGGSELPVLVLTARGSVGDRIAGLNVGADDYLAKPFDLGELQARLNALLRRVRVSGDQICGNLRLDVATGAFFNDLRPLEMSPREGALLKALMRSAGQAVTREALREQVFGTQAEPGVDAIEVLVHRLRKRIAGASAEIMTLRGIGYLLIDSALAQRHA